MECNDHRSLGEHSMAVLVKVEVLVEELLANKSVLPQELFTKLDNYHADLTAAIEGKQAETL